MKEIIMQKFSGLFQPELLEEIEKDAIIKNVVAGEELIQKGDYIRSMPLILNGVIKILREDENGDELLLYFIEEGETCAMTLTCCLGINKSEIKATAETDAQLLMIPVQKMEEWASKYKSWRNYVFESYHTRLMEALNSIDKIAFSNLDDRLVDYLKDKQKFAQASDLKITHQEIAKDLNSSRVVISRLLKKLENQNQIEIHRNQIKILTV